MTTIKLDIDSKEIDWERIRAVIQLFKLDIDYLMSRICETMGDTECPNCGTECETKPRANRHYRMIIATL